MNSGKKNNIEDLYDFICKETDHKKQPDLSEAEMIVAIKSLVTASKVTCARQQDELDRLHNRVMDVINVIQSLASRNYKKKAPVDGSGDIVDALAVGINMMSEELEASTVSLSEKEVLLNEVHHRVKNNLQLVCSLLNIQSSYITDPDALDKFRESQDRVNSMSLIHEKLYTSKDFTRIDFGDYMLSISNYLTAVYNISPDKIQVNIDIEPDSGFLPLDTALPCGLIVNELLSNSFKYAFTGREKGNINIKMTRRLEEGKSNYLLHIADDGNGLPDHFNIEECTTLGMQLVTTLVGQIDADLQVSSEKGASFIIRFEQ